MSNATHANAVAHTPSLEISNRHTKAFRALRSATRRVAAGGASLAAWGCKGVHIALGWAALWAAHGCVQRGLGSQCAYVALLMIIVALEYAGLTRAARAFASRAHVWAGGRKFLLIGAAFVLLAAAVLVRGAHLVASWCDVLHLSCTQTGAGIAWLLAPAVHETLLVLATGMDLAELISCISRSRHHMRRARSTKSLARSG